MMTIKSLDSLKSSQEPEQWIKSCQENLFVFLETDPFELAIALVTKTYDPDKNLAIFAEETLYRCSRVLERQNKLGQFMSRFIRFLSRTEEPWNRASFVVLTFGIPFVEFKVEFIVSKLLKQIAHQNQTDLLIDLTEKLCSFHKISIEDSDLIVQALQHMLFEDESIQKKRCVSHILSIFIKHCEARKNYYFENVLKMCDEHKNMDENELTSIFEFLQKNVVLDLSLEDKNVEKIVDMCLEKDNLKSLETLVLVIKSFPLPCVPTAKRVLSGSRRMLHQSSVPQLNMALTVISECVNICAVEDLETLDMSHFQQLESNEDPTVRCNLVLFYQRCFLKQGLVKNIDSATVLTFLQQSLLDESYLVAKQAICFLQELLKCLPISYVSDAISATFVFKSLKTLTSFFHDYWLKVREVVNFSCSPSFYNLEIVIGLEATKQVRRVFLRKVLLLLGSPDHRIRCHAAENLSRIITNKESVIYFENDSEVINFQEICGNLLEVQNKFIQIGTMHCLKLVLCNKRLVTVHIEVLNEFRILPILCDLLSDSCLVIQNVEFHANILSCISILMTICGKSLETKHCHKLQTHITKMLKIYQLISEKKSFSKKTEAETDTSNIFDKSYVRVYTLVETLSDIYNMNLRLESGENFLLILENVLALFETNARSFGILSLLSQRTLVNSNNDATEIIQQLSFLSSISEYYPSLLIKSVTYFVKVLSFRTKQEKTLKSFHEIDDKVLLHLKQMAAHFAKIYALESRLIKDQIFVFANHMLDLGFKIEDVDPLSVLLSDSIDVIHTRNIPVGFIEFMVRSGHWKETYLQNQLDESSTTLNQSIVDEKLLIFLDKVAKTMSKSKNIQDICMLQLSFEELLFKYNTSKILEVLEAVFKHFSKKCRERISKTLVKNLLSETLVIADASQFETLINITNNSDFNLIIDEDTNTVFKKLFDEKKKLVSKKRLSDFHLAAIALLLVKISEIELSMHQHLSDLVALLFSELTFHPIGIKSESSLYQPTLAILDTLRSLKCSHPLLYSSVICKIRKDLRLSDIRQLFWRNPRFTYFLLQKLDGLKLFTGMVSNRKWNYLSWFLKCLLATENLFLIQNTLRSCKKTKFSSKLLQKHIYELCFLWRTASLKYSQSRWVTILPTKRINFYEFVSEMSPEENLLKFCQNMCLSNWITSLVNKICDMTVLQSEHVFVQGAHAAEILNTTVDIFLNDKKISDLMQKFSAVEMCETNRINFERTCLRKIITQIISRLRKETIKKDVFTLSSSMLPKLVKYIFNKIFEEKLLIQEMTLYCDLLKFINDLIRLCEVNGVFVTPSWNNFVWNDVIRSAEVKIRILEGHQKVLGQSFCLDTASLDSLMLGLKFDLQCLNLASQVEDFETTSHDELRKNLEKLFNMSCFYSLEDYEDLNTCEPVSLNFPVVVSLKESLTMISKYCESDGTVAGQSYADFVLSKVWKKDELVRFIKRINSTELREKHQFEEIFASLMIIINTLDEDYYTEQELYHIHRLVIDCASEIVFNAHSSLLNQHFSLKELLCPIKDEQVEEVWFTKLRNTLLNSLPDNPVKNLNGQAARYILNDMYSVENALKLSQSSQKCSNKFPKTLFQKLQIDIKSPLLTLIEILESNIEKNKFDVLPFYLKLLNFVSSSEVVTYKTKIFQQILIKSAPEDSITIQYLLQIVFRTAASGVPSPEETQKLINIARMFASSNQPFVKISVLIGLHDVLKALWSTNHVIGALSEELSVFNEILTDVFLKKDEHSRRFSVKYSTTFNLLKWNFLCLCIGSILKKKHNEDILQYCISHWGSFVAAFLNFTHEFHFHAFSYQLVMTKKLPESFSKNVIKLYLQNLEKENSVSASLHLLCSSLYAGSSSEFDYIQRQNGIVFLDQERSASAMEVTEGLLRKVTLSTKEEAAIISKVMCSISQDLLSPLHVLPKIAKEFFSDNQSSTSNLGLIMFSILRSAIGASMMSLLDDWMFHVIKRLFLSSGPHTNNVWKITLLLTGASTTDLSELFYLLLVLGKSQRHAVDFLPLSEVLLGQFLTKLDIAKTKELLSIVESCCQTEKSLSTILKSIQ